MSSNRSPAAESPAVLVVDDSEANLITVQAVLTGLDCQVTAVKSGNEALRQLLKREFALVLLDVQMPEMDGYEVARHARSNPSTRDVPIIFVTATHGTEENVLRGYGSGAVDVLFKPIDRTVLRSKVQVFLELYAGRRALAEAAAAEASMARRLRESNDELTAAYKKLQATQAQLIQSAKMASLGELVAGVAHEINNPLAFAMSHLNTVVTTLDGAKASPEGDRVSIDVDRWQRARHRISEMSFGLARIGELVVKLRTFARLDEGERKVVNVKQCIESVITILRHRMRDRIELTLACDESTTLHCYPGLLNQALMNIVANAIEAIPDQGRIDIHASRGDDAFTIEVSDSGQGIPQQLRDRVFEPFFTTKPVGQGTGLGLSITYSIVRKHGGTVELSDREGGGTVVTVRLPLELPVPPPTDE